MQLRRRKITIKRSKFTLHIAALENKSTFHRSFTLLDGILLVAGSMIGSGIFRVSADVARQVGSGGWMIMVWVLTGLITVAAAVSYGELSGMFPKAGGQYVYLQEAWGKRFGFLYGWAFFAVIQTGTIAAVAVTFATFLGYIGEALFGTNFLSDTHLLLAIGSYHVTYAQVVGIASIVLLTFINTRGIESGKWIQFFFTFAKVGTILALIFCGIFLFKDHSVWQNNWSSGWMAHTLTKSNGVISHSSLSVFELVVAICVAMVGTLFSSDAWNNVTFIAGEIKKPERNIGLSLFIGTLAVTILYISMNVMYVNVLSMAEIAGAESDRVALAAALKLFGSFGTVVIAALIMVSTFGCNNGLILSGARVYYSMAVDGLFLPAAKKLNGNGVPAKALWMQCFWASVLCLSGKYGDLLDFIVFTVLVFYILTIAAIFKLRRTMPEHPRPYKAFGYPVLPALYIGMASFICIILLKYKPDYTWPGLIIVLIGLPIYYLLQKRAGNTHE